MAVVFTGRKPEPKAPKKPRKKKVVVLDPLETITPVESVPQYTEDYTPEHEKALTDTEELPNLPND